MSNLNEKQNIPSGWKEDKFLDCFDVPSKLAGIKLSEYEREGDFPVFDQGQDYISGFSSNKDLVVKNVPAILFGDHTRIVKYIKSPFVAGADGTKIFWAKDGFDSTFLYYLVLSQKIPNTGYNRHFKFFKDIKVVFPKLKIEQQKIAGILETVDEDIAKTQEVIEATEKLKRGLMQQLFTRGIGHTKFKDTKIGLVPEEWRVMSLQTMLDEGLIVSHLDGNHGELYPKSSEFIGEGIPYLSANCIEDGHVNFGKAKYLSPDRASKFLKGVAINGDILFAHNATVGPVAILNTEEEYVILSTTLTYYRCNTDELVPAYIRYFMESPLFSAQYGRVMAQTTRNQVPITIQRTFLHALPAPREQKEIAEILSAVDEKISVNKKLKEKLTLLKKGLMQDLLSGNKRVKV